MRDEWSGLVDLLANLIAKYAGVIDTDSVEIPKKQENSCECGKPQDRIITQESSAEEIAADKKLIEESIEESVEERSSA